MAKLSAIRLDPACSPWDRQPDESLTRHAQFCVYRDMGRSRSLRKVAENLTKNERYVRDIAAAYRWRERVEAYDRHLDQLYEATWVEERRKAAEADARILGAGIGKLAQRLPSMNPAELSPGDMIRLMDVTIRHRRALFGDPASTVDPEAAAQQARITEEQGMLLAQVIRRSTDALREAVAELVDENTAAHLRRQWPRWLADIVPREIAAVVGQPGGS